MYICYMSNMCKMRTWKLGFRREVIGQSEVAAGVLKGKEGSCNSG